MGLFGGSFATGLATGLATSVSEKISDDRSRREARLDRLRTFYETRQVQEQDRAKEEDRRTQKHLERLKNETGASAAEVVAIYKGLGGDNDSLDRHFSRVDENKYLGGTFSYADMLKNSGVDYSQYGNFTMKDAFDNLRYEISDVDARFTESPSFLTAIGLGLNKDAVNKSLTQGLQDIVPSVSRKDSGIAAMAVPEGFYGQTIQAQQAQLDSIVKDASKRMGVVQEALMQAKAKLNTVIENKDNLTGEAFKNAQEEAENGVKKAQENFNEEQKFYDLMESKKLSDKEMVSLTARRDGYRQEKDALLGPQGIDARGEGMSASALTMEEYKYTDPTTGQEKVATKGEKITGAAAVAYKEKKIKEFNRKYAINNLVDSNQNFIESTARLMFTDTGGLGLIPYSTYVDIVAEGGGDVAVTGGGSGPDDTVVTGGGSGPDDTVVTGGGGVNSGITVEQAQEEITNLDISNMTPEDMKDKKAEIIFNATRGVETFAEAEAVRAQLEEIFIAKGLSQAPVEPPTVTPTEAAEAARAAAIKEIEGNLVDYLVNRINATGTFIPEEDANRIIPVLINKNERTGLYPDYGSEMKSRAEFDNALKNPAVIEALQNVWDKLPVSEKDKSKIAAEFGRRGVDTGIYGTFEYAKSKIKN